VTDDATNVLLGQARRGDRAAQDALFARHAARVLVYVSFRMGSMVRRVAEPEDVLQEVYLTAFRDLDRFGGTSPGDFYRWLKGIARNHMRNLRRIAGAKKRAGEQRLASGSRPQGVSAGSETPSRAVARSEEFRSLLGRMESLDEAYRSVLFLRYYEGMKAPEIARVLRITPNAVYQRLHRAIEQMRAKP
jgi:RNA polymerase sigma-70 factor, ECF subfamily